MRANRFMILGMTLLMLACSDARAAKILFLVGEGFNAGEFWTPYLGLRAAGHDVTVAGVARGVIPAGSKDRTLDATADLALDQVDPVFFDALVIPGGDGPKNLEPHPHAIEIARAFLASDKPTAAICHGPRLLAHTGLLKGRVATALNTVKDELPDLWSRGAFGAYVDQAVVVDRNLITSRYPNDATVFTQRVHHQLAGGREAPPALREGVRVIDGGNRAAAFGVGGALAARGLGARVGGASLVDEADPATSVIVLIPGPKLAEGFTDATRREKLAALASAGRVICLSADETVQVEGATVLKGELRDTLAEAAKRCETRVPKIDVPASTDPLALIAVRDSFDDHVALGMRAVLESKGYRVSFISDAPGWRHGAQGAAVGATHTFAQPPDAKLVVAPGHVRPADEAVGAYRDFLLSRDATPMIAFGFDTLLLGTDPRFKGTRFASSDQAVWSFKGGAAYSGDDAIQSTPSLITAKGAASIRNVVRLIDAHPPR